MRATTAVPVALDAPTCNYRNRHGGKVDRATRHWPTRNAPSPRDETEGPSPRRALHGRACCSKP